MAVTQQQVKEAEDRTKKRVEVPEWGGDGFLFVVEFSAYDRLQWEEKVFDKKGNPRKDGQQFHAATVIHAAVDEHGKRIFDDDAVNWLAKQKNGNVVYRIAQAALELNGLLAGSVETAKKNS
jgi:hypothetical protein